LNPRPTEPPVTVFETARKLAFCRRLCGGAPVGAPAGRRRSRHRGRGTEVQPTTLKAPAFRRKSLQIPGSAPSRFGRAADGFRESARRAMWLGLTPSESRRSRVAVVWRPPAHTNDRHHIARHCICQPVCARGAVRGARIGACARHRGLVRRQDGRSSPGGRQQTDASEANRDAGHLVRSETLAEKRVRQQDGHHRVHRREDRDD
jgi:hypothetical protein